MNALTVKATDFSRGLSEFLNQVQYQGQTLDIERGKRVVARVSPPAGLRGAEGYPISQLGGLLTQGAQLAQGDRDQMAKDVRSVRLGLLNKADPWAS